MAQHTLDYKNPPKYNTYKKRAIEKWPSEKYISEEQFNEISSKDCIYCGKQGPNGIDRIDNKFGYIHSNCVPACKHCNYVKGDLSIDDFNTWKIRFVKKQISILGLSNV